MSEGKTASERLADHIPGWFGSPHRGPNGLSGIAKIREFSRPEREYELSIIDHGTTTVAVYETSGKLPPGCPERHINFRPITRKHDRPLNRASGAFCLGYGDAVVVHDANSACAWWGVLQQYLINQSVFDRTQTWPAKYALDHGNAARFHQIEMTKAVPLGLEQAVTASFLDQSSILNDPDLGLIDGSGNLLETAICPCSDCDPGTLVNACRPKEIRELIKLDRLRRNARASYYRVLATSGKKCCGAKMDCPLRSS